MIRNAYLKKVEERLHKLDSEIESIGKKAGAATFGVKTEISRQVDSLRKKSSIARDRIGDVRKAGAASWGHLKKHADDAVDDVRRELDEAIRKLRKTGSEDR
jgi:hypothetical protein